MKYIVIFDVFVSNEVYYCETLEEVKQTVEQIATRKEIEQGKVRVFKIESEIHLENIEDDKEKEQHFNKLFIEGLLKDAEEFLETEPGDIKYPGRKRYNYTIKSTPIEKDEGNERF